MSALIPSARAASPRCSETARQRRRSLSAGPHPEEAAKRPSRRMPASSEFVAILRDAVLRAAPQDEAGALLPLNPRGGPHLVPTGKLGEHECSELLGCRTFHRHTGLGQLVTHGLILQRIVHRLVELG